MAKREKKDVMVQESALARFLKRVGSKVLSVRQDVVIDSASRREHDRFNSVSLRRNA